MLIYEGHNLSNISDNMLDVITRELNGLKVGVIDRMHDRRLLTHDKVDDYIFYSSPLTLQDIQDKIDFLLYMDDFDYIILHLHVPKTLLTKELVGHLEDTYPKEFILTVHNEETSYDCYHVSKTSEELQ